MHFQTYALQGVHQERATYGDEWLGRSDFPLGTNNAVAQMKLPEKLYRMVEVMEFTGLSRQTLHYYATLGLIKEKKRTAAGYRLFAPTVFRALDRVKKLQNKGYTLAEIRERLESSSSRNTRTNRG